MSEISIMHKKYGCNYSTAYKTIEICNHITQTYEELREILETQDREELERYWIDYFNSNPKVTVQ